MSDERTQDEISETCDKTCEILQKTNNGNLLAPRDLKIVEIAVNGWQNELGQEAFDNLYRCVIIDGTYTKPYLHDIEHITRDHEGNIFYKGIQLENFSRSYIYSEDAKNALIAIKNRCEFLENQGIEVSYCSVWENWNNKSKT